MIKYLLIIFLNFLLISISSSSEKIKEIKINGNERISNETIKMFSKVSINEEINNNNINEIIKNLYRTNFFNNFIF